MATPGSQQDESIYSDSTIRPEFYRRASCEHYEKIIKELWEDHESIMRASVGRGIGREGGDKALAANTYPNDECESNYYCGRKRNSRSWRKAKGRGIKFWGEEGSKGRGNHERIMRRLWENHENIDGSESQKKMAANMFPIDLYESKHYLLCLLYTSDAADE